MCFFSCEASKFEFWYIKNGLLVHVGVAGVTVHKIKCKTISSVWCMVYEK